MFDHMPGQFDFDASLEKQIFIADCKAGFGRRCYKLANSCIAVYPTPRKSLCFRPPTPIWIPEFWTVTCKWKDWDK